MLKVGVRIAPLTDNHVNAPPLQIYLQLYVDTVYCTVYRERYGSLNLQLAGLVQSTPIRCAPANLGVATKKCVIFNAPLLVKSLMNRWTFVDEYWELRLVPRYFQVRKILLAQRCTYRFVYKLLRVSSKYTLSTNHDDIQ